MSNQYPAQQSGWGPAPSPRRKRHVGRWVGLAVAAVVVVIFAASLAGGGNSDTAGPSTGTAAPAADSGVSRGLGGKDATADVRIDKGSASVSYGLVTATLTITNHSSKRSDYYVEATLLNAAGENIGTANALVSSVEPSQVAHAELNGSVTGKLHSIKITQVQRTASV
jgi:hypothetical protein